jgi:hypothetical protein
MIPTKDTTLPAWAANFNERINATPLVFSIQPDEALAFTSLYDVFIAAMTALNAAEAAGIASKSLHSAKNSAKRDLLAYGRELYARIQSSLSVSNANKDLVGVKVRKTTRTSATVPTAIPEVDIRSVNGRTLSLQLHDAEANRRKPEGVDNAVIMTFVGATPPDESGAWKLEGTTGRTRFDVTFAPSVEPGATVWVTVFWANSAGYGPACTPVSWTFGASEVENSGTLKLAA